MSNITFKLFPYDTKKFSGEGNSYENDIPITTLSRQPDLHEHITAGGKTYVVCAIVPSRQFAGVHEIDLTQEYDTEYTDNMICPHCGYEDHDSWECGADEDDRNCGRCGLLYRYTREVTVSYSTEKVSGSNA